GLSICIDNYPAAGPGAPAVKAKWRGVQFASVIIPKWNSTTFIPITVTQAVNGMLTVNINGTNVFNNIMSPYQAGRGRFGFYARTGGERQTHWIDDLTITVPDYGYVTLSGTNVLYAAPRNNCGVDTFYYLVGDNQ